MKALYYFLLLLAWIMLSSFTGFKSYKPELVVQTGHNTYINSVAFSPDGKYLASGSSDKTTKLYEVTSGKELRTFIGHTSWVNSVAFSPDGNKIISSSGDNSIILWDSKTGKPIHTFKEYNSLSTSVAYSPDGSKIASGSWDNKIILWDSRTGKPIDTLKGHTSHVKSVAFSPDGCKIVSGSEDNKIILWDSKTGNPLDTLKGHTFGINSVAFSPDGSKIVSGSEDNKIILWDSKTGNPLDTLKGHTSGIKLVAFSPNGSEIVSGSGDGTIILWDAYTGHQINTLKGYDLVVESVAYSPDGSKIACGSWDNKIILWDSRTGKPIDNIKGHTSIIFSVAFSPDGNKIACGSGDGTILLWDLKAGNKIDTFKGHTSNIFSVTFSPDGSKIACGRSGDGTIILWDSKTGKSIDTLKGDTTNIYTVAFSPDGNKIACGRGDNTLILWDSKTGNQIWGDSKTSNPLDTLIWYTSGINSVAFSPNGSKIVSGSGDGTIILWDAYTGHPIDTLKGHILVVESVAYSPDGSKIASGSWDNKIILWDSRTGKPIDTLIGHTSHVKSVAFSPDGSKIISGSWDGKMILWDSKTGKPIDTLIGHTSDVSSIAFSSDGSKITSGSWDGTIKLWDVKTSKLLVTLIRLDINDWAVVTPEGYFDASDGGMKLLHFTVGMEPVELDQFNKDIFWKPGLLRKVLGYDVDTIPKRPPLNQVYLYPEIELVPPTKDNLKLGIKLKNQGGGFGKVSVWIDNKEITDDSRFESNAKVFINNRQIEPDYKLFDTLACDYIYIELSLPDYLITPGEKNELQVSAWNYENFIRSRRQTVIYDAPRKDNYRQPHIFAVSVGVSDYQGNQLDLKFADKDAESIARVLKVAGQNLIDSLGGKYHEYLLTSPQKPGTSAATKDNIIKNFKRIADSVLPSDILTIYLSGHGINFGNEFYYITSEAESKADIESSERRSMVAISFNELLTLIKKIAAKKVVMIVDACGSGKIMENEELVAMKSVDENQIKAVERMKDRGGIHILSGCAADQSSYETTSFGEGLLTYSLLEGIKGAALNNDMYIDVDRLFNYAADRVQVLAEGIGGIQKPQIASPRDSRSFDIGIVRNEDKNKIQIPIEKPLFVRSSIQEEKEMDDILDITNLLDSKLNQITARGVNAQIVFIDVKKFGEAYKIVGRYTIDAENISIRTNIIHEKRKFEPFEIKGNKSEIESLLNKIIDKVFEEISTNN